MTFEFDNNVPIYLQLVEEIIMNIVSGKLQPGQRLPSVRDFALQNKVNPNTMQKALAQLEDLKLIYTERTNGKYVTQNKKIIEKYKNKYAKELAEKYLLSMKNIGFEKNEALKYLESIGGK